MAAELSIERVFHTISKRIVLLILLPIITGVGSGVVSMYLIDDVYQASSMVIVSSQTKITELDQLTVADYSLNVQLVESYRILCKSNRVLDQVIAELDLPITADKLRDKIAVTAAGDTEIIHILVKDEDPVRAQRITNTLTRIFQREVKNIIKMDNVQIIDEAQIPTIPVEPNRARNAILGVLVGFVLGIGIAFLLEYFDRSVTSEEHVAEILMVPVLGSVPKINEKAAGSSNQKTDLVISAIFGRLLANIDFSFVRMKNLCLMITSSVPDEGKTTIVAHTASEMAASGKKTLIVDSDMSNAGVHLRFNCVNSHGLSDIISQDVDWRQYVIKTNTPNLYIITAGRKPLNTMKFVRSEWFKSFLEEVKEEFDYVLLDTAPLLVIPDSQIISSLVDGVILVVNGGKTTASELGKSAELLKRADANLIGAIFNNIKARGWGYGYGYGYANSKEKNDKIDIDWTERKQKTTGTAAIAEKKANEIGMKEEPFDFYCIVCRTGTELTVAKNIKKAYPELTVIAPVKIMKEKRQGHWENKEHILLPGYIFLLPDFTQSLNFQSMINKVYHNPENSIAAKIITGSDAEYARWIYHHQGTIKTSKVVIKQGGATQVIDGPLLDFPGSITKIDKNNRRALVEFTFDGQKKAVYMDVECITPVENLRKETAAI